MPSKIFDTIYTVLKKRIEKGIYKVGELLPSENTLITEFACSRNTVRRAISELVKDGYVQTHQGKGVCNIYQEIEKSSYNMGKIESFNETAKRTGLKGKSQVIEFKSIICDESISKLTNFSEGIKLFALKRVHYLNDKAKILNISYFRYDLMPNLTAEIAKKSIYKYLEEELKMVIITSKRTITVDRLIEDDEKYIDLDGFNCVALISNQVYNSDGVMFEFTQSRHSPDIFRFQENAIR